MDNRHCGHLLVPGQVEKLLFPHPCFAVSKAEVPCEETKTAVSEVLQEGEPGRRVQDESLTNWQVPGSRSFLWQVFFVEHASPQADENVDPC